MKKIQSVAVRFILFFVLGIIVFSGVLSVVINTQLNKGFLQFMEDTLNKNVEGVNIKIENIEEENGYIANWIALTIGSSDKVQNGKINGQYAKGLCINATEGFNVDHAAVYDVNAVNISETSIGTIGIMPIVNDTLRGNVNNTLLKVMKDIYAISTSPIKRDGKIIGVAAVARQLSNNDFVEDIARTYDVEATYFSGYTRTYTTMTDLKGKDIKQKDRIDRVMKGEAVLEVAQINDIDYLVNYFPIKNEKGEILSAFFIGKEVSTIEMVAHTIFVPLIIAAIFITLVLIFFMIVIVYKIILKKINYVNHSVKDLRSAFPELKSFTL